MITSDLGCGSQGNLLLQSTKKDGADAPFSLTDQRRALIHDIMGYLERNIHPDQIAQRMRIEPVVVHKYLSALRSSI